MRALDEATRDGVSYGRQLYLQVPAGLAGLSYR